MLCCHHLIGQQMRETRRDLHCMLLGGLDAESRIYGYAFATQTLFTYIARFEENNMTFIGAFYLHWPGSCLPSLLALKDYS
jgi:hypothetical protein